LKRSIVNEIEAIWKLKAVVGGVGRKVETACLGKTTYVTTEPIAGDAVIAPSSAILQSLVGFILL